MKFARRISSICRIAWKQCRSCSADPLSIWPDSFARKGARRVDPLAARFEHGCHGVLREPVDLEVGSSLRSSSAIAASRWAWPSPIGEEI
jgi:hypothetical protein